MADPEVLGVVAEIARRLNERQAQITSDMSELLAREIAELDTDQRLLELMNASVDANVKTLFHMLVNNIPIEHLQPTTAAVEYAVRLAQRDIPAHALIRAYHMGQDDFMNAVYAEAQLVESRPEVKLGALHHTSVLVFRYIDWISMYVLDVYQNERKRWAATRGNMHSSLIHQIIAGQPVDEAAFEAGTSYHLELFHVGIVVWSTKNSADPDEHRALEPFVRGLAAKCAGSGPPLINAIDRATVWAWLPFHRRPRIDMDAIRSLATKTRGCRVSLGLPGFAVAGFKRSHDQAEAARRVALAAAGRMPAAVSFGDHGVAVVSLLAKDIESTTQWISEVLGPLARDNEHAELLRDTVRVYFLTGENYAKTSELLNLHRNTVKYRVGKVFGDRGNPIGHDRMDFALALQVCHFLGATVLSD